MDLANGDWVVIGVYASILIVITLWHTKKKNEASEFLLAGRRLTLPIFIATLVSTWYGGIFGIAEFTNWYGLGAWLTQGIFWYVVYFIFALFFAKKIRDLPYYTIPDILENRYGKKAAFVGGIFTYIMVNPAPYLLSLGLIIAYFSSLSLFTSIIIATMFCVIYTWFAGFRGVVYTDVFQFFWMFASFSLLFYLAISRWGGYEFLQENLPAQKLTLTGGINPAMLAVWAGLSCWVLVDPNFYQRCAAAKSSATAQKGIFICIGFWFLFDIVAIGSAMYGFAALEAKEIIIPSGQSQYVYLILADQLMDSPFKGLFIAGIVSTIMSTADSFLFVAAVNISRDYYWRYLNREANDDQLVAVTRKSILITAVFAAMLAILFPKVSQLWYILGYVGLSSLLIPVGYTFFTKKSSSATLEKAALSSMISGCVASLSWSILGLINMTNEFPVYPWGIEPLYLGLTASSTFFAYFVLSATRLPLEK